MKITLIKMMTKMKKQVEKMNNLSTKKENSQKEQEE